MQAKFGKYSDLELLDRIRSGGGDREMAFAELYGRYSSKIYSFCLRMLGDSSDAQDAFQDCILHFYDAVLKGREVKFVQAYLYQIARRHCLNFKRDKKNMVGISELDFVAVRNEYEDAELMDLIMKSLDLLEPDYKEAFILRQLHGLSYAEVSEITEEKVSTIKTRVWRAKDKIKQILTPYLEDLTK
ncbi:MAG: RNA polymerase sigma factor [Chloroflexota bacterium]